MEPIATFAIPCRDAGEFLAPLVESLLAQTRQDFALLLVDDASSDGSVERARAIAGDRIAVHANPTRIGLARNWNRCAELVRTELFCLAHMDDVYEADYLERMVEALEARSSAALVHCPAVAIDARGARVARVAAPAEAYKQRALRRLGRADRAATFALLFRGNAVNCPSVLYRKRAWDAVGGVDPAFEFAPDWKLWFAFLIAGYELAVEPRELVRYRRHGRSQSDACTRDLRRYREERAVLEWAAEAGVRAGLVTAADVGTRTAVRDNALLDAYRDATTGDLPAARAKLAFLRDEVPALADDRIVRIVARLVELGRFGRVALGVGLRAAIMCAGR